MKEEPINAKPKLTELRYVVAAILVVFGALAFINSVATFYMTLLGYLPNDGGYGWFVPFDLFMVGVASMLLAAAFRYASAIGS